MTRFTTTLYAAAADFASHSWLASTPPDNATIRASLSALGLSAAEEELASGNPLFDILVTNTHHGSRTTYGLRTANEIRSIVAANLGGFHALPEPQQAALETFLNRAEGTESFTFLDSSCELSVERRTAG